VPAITPLISDIDGVGAGCEKKLLCVFGVVVVWTIRVGVIALSSRGINRPEDFIAVSFGEYLHFNISFYEPTRQIAANFNPTTTVRELMNTASVCLRRPPIFTVFGRSNMMYGTEWACAIGMDNNEVDDAPEQHPRLA
jgi:hypothetical protein